MWADVESDNVTSLTSDSVTEDAREHQGKQKWNADDQWHSAEGSLAPTGWQCIEGRTWSSGWQPWHEGSKWSARTKRSRWHHNSMTWSHKKADSWHNHKSYPFARWDDDDKEEADRFQHRMPEYTATWPKLAGAMDVAFAFLVISCVIWAVGHTILKSCKSLWLWLR